MKRAGQTFFDFTTKHHEGFSMYDTNTRVHDCWDFDLSPGAKHVKGIKPCIPLAGGGRPSPSPCLGSDCKYTSKAGTKCEASAIKTLTHITKDAAQSACSADLSCAGFDFYVDNDVGRACAEGLKEGEGCSTMKSCCATTQADKTNTAFIKQGFSACGAPSDVPLPPDGIAYSSMEAFGRDITGELVAAARKGGIIPGLYFSNIDWFDPDMRIDQWNAVAAAGKLCDGIACDPKAYNRSTFPAQWQRFVLRHRAQVLEVLTKYGEICEASFDMNFPAIFDDDVTDTFMLARQLAPNTLFRGRGMGGKREDGTWSGT